MNTWSALLPALLSLVGVGLGTVGTLVGQYLSSRVSTRQHDAQQWAAHRAELKASIMRFVSLVQQVTPPGRPDGRAGTPAQSPSERLVNELWLAQHELDLVAVSEELRGATYRYAQRLTTVAARESHQERGDDLLREAQIEFMDAARRDLWPSGPTLAGRR
jgi:hypothetical protein